MNKLAICSGMKLLLMGIFANLRQPLSGYSASVCGRWRHGREAVPFPKPSDEIRYRSLATGAVYLNDFTAAASSSFTSKTVYSLVICSRSLTFLVSLSSFSSPP